MARDPLEIPVMLSASGFYDRFHLAGLKWLYLCKRNHREMKNIAIFASGSGTNAQNITEYFAGDSQVRVALVLSNRPDARVLDRASRLGVPSYVFDRKEFYESRNVLEVLRLYGHEPFIFEVDVEDVCEAAFFEDFLHDLVKKVGFSCTAGSDEGHDLLEV